MVKIDEEVDDGDAEEKEEEEEADDEEEEEEEGEEDGSETERLLAAMKEKPSGTLTWQAQQEGNRKVSVYARASVGWRASNFLYEYFCRQNEYIPGAK